MALCVITTVQDSIGRDLCESLIANLPNAVNDEQGKAWAMERGVMQRNAFYTDMKHYPQPFTVTTRIMLVLDLLEVDM